MSILEAEKQSRRPGRVLRAPEAANYIGLSESTLAKRRLYGLPPAFLNLGWRSVGYAIDELDRWLDSCRRQSTSQAAGAQHAKAS
jgi:predicted DNA-binding transcriptional regulator AlpA